MVRCVEGLVGRLLDDHCTTDTFTSHSPGFWSGGGKGSRGVLPVCVASPWIGVDPAGFLRQQGCSHWLYAVVFGDSGTRISRWSGDGGTGADGLERHPAGLPAVSRGGPHGRIAGALDVGVSIYYCPAGLWQYCVVRRHSGAGRVPLGVWLFADASRMVPVSKPGCSPPGRAACVVANFPDCLCVSRCFGNMQIVHFPDAVWRFCCGRGTSGRTAWPLFAWASTAWGRVIGIAFLRCLGLSGQSCAARFGESCSALAVGPGVSLPVGRFRLHSWPASGLVVLFAVWRIVHQITISHLVNMAFLFTTLGFFEWIGALESARLLEMGPDIWIHCFLGSRPLMRPASFTGIYAWWLLTWSFGTICAVSSGHGV